MLPLRTCLAFILLLCACSHQERKPVARPVTAPAKILDSYASLYNYKVNELMLTVSYTALDTAAKEMSREAFLKAFATGRYLPLRLHTADSAVRYQLYPVPDSTPADVKSALTYYGKTYYGYFKEEGKPFPFIPLEDINGQVYTKTSANGKILVVKCWFIHCVACVKEMPELNRLVQQYNNRDDIQFLSLAFDSREQLRNFMKNTAFRYAVIPVPESYISDSLHVGVFPTHLIVNRQGIIRSITTETGELAAALQKVARE